MFSVICGCNRHSLHFVPTMICEMAETKQFDINEGIKPYTRSAPACVCMPLQVFSPRFTGPDDKGTGKEKEVAAVHYSADKMDPHGR